MNTKTTTHGDMLRAHADIADYSSRGDFTAQYLRDAAGIIDAQAEEIEHLKRDLDNIRYVLEDYGKHTNRAQSTLSPSGLGKNYLHAALDQLDKTKASVAELEGRFREATALLRDLLEVEGAESYGEYRASIMAVLAKRSAE